MREAAGRLAIGARAQNLMQCSDELLTEERSRTVERRARRMIRSGATFA